MLDEHVNLCKVVGMTETMSTTIYTTLLTEVRAQRARLELDQKDLAAAMGMHPETLKRRLAHPEDISLGELVKMCSALKVDFAVIMGGAQVLTRTFASRGRSRLTIPTMPS